MGLGPSIKMTTLHHYHCPVTKTLSADPDVDFAGIIVDGVSEICDDKVFTAVRTGFMAEGLRIDGAIVAIDGWGNHHIDFVNVIEQLGRRGIPSVGLSYIGLQGRLVCTNEYVETVVDFNKCASGYESGVVGQNNLTDLDAFKAVALLKHKIQKRKKHPDAPLASPQELRRLTRVYLPVQEACFGTRTSLNGDHLTIREGIERKILERYPRIKNITMHIVHPEEHDFFVNSNLDYAPIATKVRGPLGEGETYQLDGITMMLTGAEDKSGFQPSNIGSSEGILKDQVVLDQAGTPRATDIILHIDCCFEEGEGRTAQGIRDAHAAADQIVDEIRAVMRSANTMSCRKETFCDLSRPGKKRIALIKIVSGLGNMYDTSLFPDEPGGYRGSRQMISMRNMPVYITPNQCRDGVIHSLL